MSYTKFYEPMFIKVQNQFLPMLVSGDSSVREYYSNKISRSWSKLSTQKNGQRSYLSTEKELKDMIRQALNEMQEKDGYNPDSYGWKVGLAIGNKHTSGTTFNDYKNFILRGIKTAVSFEQMKAENKAVRIFDYSWDGDAERETGHSNLSRDVDTESEFLSNLSELEKIVKGTKKEGEIFFDVLGLIDEYDVKEFKRSVKRGYIITDRHECNYVMSIFKKRVCLHYNIKKAKVYRTLQAAENARMKHAYLEHFKVIKKD